MLDGGVRSGGPIPKFNDYHIWKALNHLNEKDPVGRKKLSAVLGIGEGSTRTILNIMQDENLISIGKSGIFLTSEGLEIKKKLHMDVVRIPAGSLTIGEWDCAVRVPRMARNVRYGCEERDCAIISGAKGATTLVYTNNRLTFAGSEYPVDPETEAKIKAAMTLKNEDVIIIGTGQTPESAENGAVAAGLHILGGLGFGREDKTLLSPNISGNELISLAFAIHDLVGGLPVCAKSRNNLGIRIENGKVVDNAYTGEVLEEVIDIGTTIRRIATSGPYKGIRVIVTPIEMDSHIIAAIGVVDIRTMAGVNNLIRLRSDDERIDLGFSAPIGRSHPCFHSGFGTWICNLHSFIPMMYVHVRYGVPVLQVSFLVMPHGTMEIRRSPTNTLNLSSSEIIYNWSICTSSYTDTRK